MDTKRSAKNILQVFPTVVTFSRFSFSEIIKINFKNKKRTYFCSESIVDSSEQIAEICVPNITIVKIEKSIASNKSKS